MRNEFQVVWSVRAYFTKGYVTGTFTFFRTLNTIAKNRRFLAKNKGEKAPMEKQKTNKMNQIEPRF